MACDVDSRGGFGGIRRAVPSLELVLSLRGTCASTLGSRATGHDVGRYHNDLSVVTRVTK